MSTRVLGLLALILLEPAASLAWTGVPDEGVERHPRYISARGNKMPARTRRVGPPQSRRRSISAEDIGLNPDTGEVHNSTESLFTFELDTSAAYAARNSAIKLGISGTVARYVAKDGTGLRFSLDVFNNLVGASIGYTFLPVLRPTMSLGYGKYFGSEKDFLQQQGKPTDTVYFKASVRLW